MGNSTVSRFLVPMEKRTIEKSHSTMEGENVTPAESLPKGAISSKNDNELGYIDEDIFKIEIAEDESSPMARKSAHFANPGSDDDNDDDDNDDDGDYDEPCCDKSRQDDISKKNYPDWEMVDSICKSKGVDVHICQTCRDTKNLLYTMLSTYGLENSPKKIVVHCLCTTLGGKYFPLDETRSLQFSSGDLISTIYNHIHATEQRNRFTFYNGSDMPPEEKKLAFNY